MGFPRVVFLAVISVLLGQTVCESFNFTSFNDTITDRFISNNSNIAYDALQVTQETRNPKYPLENQSGRVIYGKAYKFWREDGVPVSFNTTFVLNIQVESGDGGEGMAFIITSQKDVKDKPEESHGLWLGLFNSSINGNSSNEMVAVEFDTMKNSGTNDPDGNHIGINVNNINSINFTSLNGSRINLTNSESITVWIQFNGDQRQLNVYLANGAVSNDPIPSQPHLSTVLNLSGVLGPEVHFGFSASTGNGTELNCVLSWSLSIETWSTDRRVLVIVLSAVAGSLFVAALVVIILIAIKYRKSRAESADIAGTIQNLPGHPREFKYKDLKKATHNFSAQSQLGRGGFGSVHKAVFPKDKTTVAVKRMFKESKQGKREFIGEISIINRLRHRNLVPLLGWCHHSGQLMMVYEYMPNGSLEKHIDRGSLDWEQRYNILSGVASALLYLHEECEQQVIHRDLKASNIMLDNNYVARLGDFGLARLIEHDRTSLTPTDVAGTPGYIAPECYHTGRASVESDVFGFGAVVIEVVCGRSIGWGKEAPNLVGWVWDLHRENKLIEAADCRISLAEAASVNEDDIKRLLLVGLACSNPNPAERPSMRQVKQILCREVPPPFVPPFRPPFVWPYSDFNDSTSAVTSVSTEYGSTMKPFIQSPAVCEEETTLQQTYNSRSLFEFDR